MGTNFYFFTKNKETKNKYFGDKYEIVDDPDFGYMIHIAKTSMGWLPLFESHRNIKSVADLKKIYNTGTIIIYDEYNTSYSWDAFEERVLKFNGGTRRNRIIESISPIEKSDPYVPDYVPISHFEYKAPYYDLSEYFEDAKGYEFTKSAGSLRIYP